MSLLLFPNGEYFAIGAINYAYRPAITSDTTNRIIIVVYVEDSITEAVLDTGAPYPIIAPKVAKQAGLYRVKPLERKRMLVRGNWLGGSIIRLNMTLLADEGEDLTVDATAFIPDVEEYWGDFPCFIGQMGFLERIRYALDPDTDTFYFGTL
jgi:hypothetical protein